MKARSKTDHKGPLHHSWKGGKYLNSDGYVMIKCEGHPKANRDGYVREHRLVMEGKLQRYLEPWELPHHKNEIKTDNKPKNLELLSRHDHNILHDSLGIFS